MGSLKPALSMVLCLALAALLSSCASFQNRPRQIAETVSLAQEQVARGEYRSALALYAAADDRFDHDPALQHQYVRTGDRIRSVADAAFQRERFSQAGGIYRVLLESGITGRSFQEPLSFDAVYLRNKIGSCSNALMELGLVKYREQDLDKAFSIWSKALEFDPGNKAITKALQTTGKQRQKLKNIGSTPK